MKPIFKIIKREWGETQVVVGNRVIIERVNDGWLKAYVPYDKKGWIEFIRTIDGRRWDVEGKYWALPYVKESISRLRDYFDEGVVFSFVVVGDIPEKFVPLTKQNINIQKIEPKLSAAHKLAITAMEEMLMLKRYSYATVKSYKSHLRRFLIDHPKLPADQITEEHIKKYLLKLIRERFIAESTQNQIINALKFYMEQVLGRDRMYIDLDRPKVPKSLPKVLSEKEVRRLLKSVDNIKHQCILILIYSAGLRLGEVVNLKLEDFDKDRKLLFIKDGKGKKDQYTLLSEKVLVHLREYYRQYRPRYWLFEGQYGGQYSKSSVQKIFNKAVQKAKIRKRATVHTLRHSFASHLVEKGVSLNMVQELLGHESIKTTEVYLHISDKYLKNIRSPFDDLEI